MRIFAAYQHFNWENYNLLPALQSFGECIHYDWHPPYDQYAEGWHFGLKQNMNWEMFRRVREAHSEKPLDVFFGYLCGRLVFRGTLEAIRLAGIPMLNIALDDKTHRYSYLEPTGFAGMIDVVSAFDLNWTSDPNAVDWYKAHGARVIYMPEGANPDVFVPRDCERDIDVLFVGKKYAHRPMIVSALQEAGIKVEAYGIDWPNGPISQEDMIDKINRAKITLGISGTSDPDLIGIKGRDTEVPMCGGLYLVQHNHELAEHWDIGGEIDTWEDLPELVTKVVYYLVNPQKGEDMRHRAAERGRRDHTWRKRFERAFGEMGL